MTGFGSAALEQGARRIAVETRSVNHRYLKVQIKVARALAPIEDDIELAVQKALRRGAVTVNMTWRDPGAKSAYRVDEDTVLHYRRMVEGLWAKLDRREPAWFDPIGPLLQLPGVVLDRREEGEDAVDDVVRDLVLRALDEALAALLRSREAEGSALSRVLSDHARALERFVDAVAARAPVVPQEQRDRLISRVRALLSGLDPQVTVSEAELLRELCLLADRADVTEELNRLRSHLAQFRAILEGGGEVGRRLDFLLQEMLRETNTVGSKANDAPIAHAVVEMKCEIERMKEQVQNLE
jgi:uncharacterized protein (TIGR00255 family)